MKEHRRSQIWLVVAVGVMSVLAAIFYIFAISGFSLSFGACDGTFSLDAYLIRCRRPVMFLLLFWSCVALGVAFLATVLTRSLIKRRRPKDHGR